MLFNSWGYLLFLLVVVPVYWLMPAARHRVPLLAAASVGFYAMWRWEFSLLVIFSAAVDYFAARRIAASSEQLVRRGWLAVSLLINLSLLVFFKYTYFIVDNVRWLGAITGSHATSVTDLGFEIILPLGISFYTFQTISYTIDVYRRVGDPVDDFVVFLAYVMFWPQLIAGPILRAGEVVPELLRERAPSVDYFVHGSTRVLYGLAKKVVIADTVASHVDEIFAQDPQWFTAIDVWAGAVLFGFQIYFDFSGYSDMAIGSARLLGVRFPENFRWPYAAVSPKDFWGRWHISLSSWIRDYLYLPLTGQVFRTSSRGGLEEASAAEASDRRRDRALVLTWFIMGLWHGAQWTFALWGLFHAFWVLSYRWVPFLSRLPTRRPLIAWAVAFPIAMAGWVPFRAASVHDAFSMWGKLLTPSAYRWSGHRVDIYAYALVGLLVIGTSLGYLASEREAWLSRIPRPVMAIGYALAVALMVCGVLLCMRRVQQFIYFQF